MKTYWTFRKTTVFIISKPLFLSKSWHFCFIRSTTDGLLARFQTKAMKNLVTTLTSLNYMNLFMDKLSAKPTVNKNSVYPWTLQQYNVRNPILF